MEIDMSTRLQQINPRPESQATAKTATSASGDRKVDDLPPSALTGQRGSGDPGEPNSRGKGGRSWLGTGLACLVSAAVLGTIALWGLGNDETSAPNWPHVQAATESGRTMQWLATGGVGNLSDHIYLSEDDLDIDTTRAIQQALARGDHAAADAIFQTVRSPDSDVAGDPPTGDPKADPVAAEISAESTIPLATLTPGMRSEIQRGDTRFFHIHLYDSCYEDGDVVEVLINGQPMFVVPLTNVGTTLTVPISSSQATVVALRGIRDGRGGITVACRTSRGEGFIRVMAPGEIQPLGVVTQ